MLIKIGSFLLVLLMTGYTIFYFRQNQFKNTRHNKILRHVFIGGATATAGYLLMQATNYHLVMTIAGMFLYAVIGGFLVGESTFKLRGLTEILSGVLGGTIGALVGYLSFISTTSFFVIDIVFILFIYLLLKQFDKQNAATTVEVKKKKVKKSVHMVKPSYALPISLAIPTLILWGYIGLNSNELNLGIIGQPLNKEATLDEANQLQTAVINVTPSGFDPRNTTIQSGTMVKIVVNATIEEGKTLTLLSDGLNLRTKLRNGNNMILLDNPIQGQYDISIDNSKINGTITVK